MRPQVAKPGIFVPSPPESAVCLHILTRNVHKSLFGNDLMQVLLHANATFALFFCRLLRSIRQPQRRQRPACHKSDYSPRINHSVQTRTTRSHRRRSYLRGSSSLKTWFRMCGTAPPIVPAFAAARAERYGDSIFCIRALLKSWKIYACSASFWSFRPSPCNPARTIAVSPPFARLHAA